jgi:integrase/recombinase XerC
LSDVTGLKVDGYRDTAGIAPQGFQSIISLPDRATLKGCRDYAILRLLWDNALKRGEISNLNVEDFVSVGKASAASEASMEENLVAHVPHFAKVARKKPNFTLTRSSEYK